MTVGHDSVVVAVSSITALAACYVSLDLGRRVRTVERAALYLLAVGAFASGIGVWWVR
jgi:NO-binding membrane sensor protein with MHYT domain